MQPRVFLFHMSLQVLLLIQLVVRTRMDHNGLNKPLIAYARFSIVLLFLQRRRLLKLQVQSVLPHVSAKIVLIFLVAIKDTPTFFPITTIKPNLQ